MKQYFSGFGCVLSIWLCAMSVGLWVQSYDGAECVERHVFRCDRHDAVSLGWDHGRLWVAARHSHYPEFAGKSDRVLVEWQRKGGHGAYYGIVEGRPRGGNQTGHPAAMGFDVRRKSDGRGRLWAAFVPFWFLASVFAIAPLRHGARAVREAAVRRRIRIAARNGVCRRCGYDLRATPGRCPECGLGARAPAG